MTAELLEIDRKIASFQFEPGCRGHYWIIIQRYLERRTDADIVATKKWLEWEFKRRALLAEIALFNFCEEGARVD